MLFTRSYSFREYPLVIGVALCWIIGTSSFSSNSPCGLLGTCRLEGAGAAFLTVHGRQLHQRDHQVRS